MRKAKWVTCTLVATVFGMAAATIGQQLPTLEQSPPQAGQTGQATARQPGLEAQQPAIPSQPGPQAQPATLQPPDRSLLRDDRSHPAQLGESGQAEMRHENARGELGVWLVAMDGPGVEIRRITEGSAAQQAGLRPGDVLMQINERWVASPQTVAQMIREIPIGQTATLHIWRDGQPQQFSATIAPARQATIAMDREALYDVGFRGDESDSNGDLGQRIMRLERQLGMVTQELQQLRQQLAQVRTSGAVEQAAGIDAPLTPPAAQPGATQTDQTAPPPGFEPPSQDATQPDAGEAPSTDQKTESGSLFQ